MVSSLMIQRSYYTLDLWPYLWTSFAFLFSKKYILSFNGLKILNATVKELNFCCKKQHSYVFISIFKQLL